MGMFFFSAQPATKSKAASNAVKEKVIAIADKIFPGFKKAMQKPGASSLLTFLVRKCAHLFLFFVLGFLSSLNAKVWKIPKKRYAFAFLFCALYALTDEVHQYFVPGRAMQLTDVLLDSFGALLGICTFLLFFHAERQKSDKVEA